MKIRYDSKADAMYITFKDEKVDHTKEIDENTIIDFNKEGKVIGLELLFVKEKNPELLKSVLVENVISG
jgi:uncharacterized protein YuzE